MSFAETWDNYEKGFGNVGKGKNFWLGNKYIHLLSNCYKPSAGAKSEPLDSSWKI